MFTEIYDAIFHRLQWINLQVVPDSWTLGVCNLLVDGGHGYQIDIQYKSQSD